MESEVKFENKPESGKNTPYQIFLKGKLERVFSTSQQINDENS